MKKIILILLCLLALLFFPSAQSPSGKPNIVDNYGLLSAEEKSELQEKIDKIGEDYQLDVVLVTVDSLEGKSPMEFADDYYDYGGYGYGENYDGVLFLISMEYRDWWISTTGKAIDYYTDYGLEKITQKAIDYFSVGNYYKGYSTLLKMLDCFAKEAITNKPYDIDHSYIPYVYLIKIIPSAIVGIIVAVILRKVLISKHNDVKKAVEARLYTNGKIDFTVNKDSLVYVEEHSHYSPVSSGSSSSGGSSRSGGSSTHTSSSGRSHGGRGGKF